MSIYVKFCPIILILLIAPIGKQFLPLILAQSNWVHRRSSHAIMTKVEYHVQFCFGIIAIIVSRVFPAS